MTAYRSAGAALALAALCACSSRGAPHPQGWSPAGNGTWTTVSGAGPERYHYSSMPTQGGLSDLASSTAVNTAVRNHGARLLHSLPFPACPGEAGLATYTLAQGRILEVGFSVQSGQAIVVQYERPASVGDAPEVTQAFRQALCFVP